MAKRELIIAVCNSNPHIPKKVIEDAVSCFFEIISFYLAHHQRAELRGFGSFSIRKRPAHAAHNPQTGEKIFVSEKFVPFFKASQTLKNKLKERSDTEKKKGRFFSFGSPFPCIKK